MTQPFVLLVVGAMSLFLVVLAIAAFFTREQ